MHNIKLYSSQYVFDAFVSVTFVLFCFDCTYNFVDFVYSWQPDTAPAVPVGPPTYAESPPDYTYINTVYSGVYEEVDNQYKAPPTYQSISNNNGYPN